MSRSRWTAGSTGESLFPRLARFRVVRRLGEGGAGMVYEAFDRERGGHVALKMLRTTDGEQLLRLKGEFRSIQDIEHPNLIRLFELMCEGETWFFTMEVIVGSTFVNYVTTKSRTEADEEQTKTGRNVSHSDRPKNAYAFDEAKLRSSLRQLASGLVAVHAAGKTHCDIKPSNVLVTDDGRVVILDFGLVRDVSHVSTLDTGGILGTVSYMAPEQALGEDVSAPADWYAVGSLLYLCLTGRRPFEGDEMEVLRRKVEEDPPSPRNLVPAVPEDLDELCMDLLRRDPASRPSDADVLRRLGTGGEGRRSRAPSTGSVQSAFVGREAEIAELQHAFDRVLAHEAATIVVEGESGVGKSATVRCFTQTLERASEAVVLSGRCYERETVPFKAVDGVIDSLSDYLSTLPQEECAALLPETAVALVRTFPVLGRLPRAVPPRASLFVSAQEGRQLLFSALRRLLTDIASARPLVVVIDDLQWADADSLMLLSEVLRPPEAPPLLLVVTTRIRPQSVTDAERTPFGLPGDVRLLPIRRLDGASALALVAALADDISPSVAQRIADEARGHPLFVDELVRHARLLGGKSPEALNLDAALVERVARLDPRERGLLELLCVAGTAVPQQLLMRTTGMVFADFAKHTQVLRAAHLARTHGAGDDDGIEPFHDRVREAVAGHLTADRLRAYHMQLAVALEGTKTPDPSALSRHWLGAGEKQKAGAYARDAAEQALKAFAFDRAAELFARALELGQLTPEGAQELRVKLADTLATAGRGAEAAKFFFDAARSAPGDRAVDLRRRGAEELLSAGRVDEGIAAVTDVLRTVGLRFPRSGLEALLGLLLFRFILLLRGLKFEERTDDEIAAKARMRVDVCGGVASMLNALDTIRGSYFQTRGLLSALELGDGVRLATSLTLEAAFVAAPGPKRAARAERLLARAGAIAGRTANMDLHSRVTSGRGYSLFFEARFPEALASFEQSLATLREHCPASFWLTRTTELGAIWALGWMGELSALAGRVEEGVRQAERRGDLYATTTLRTGVPNLVWLRRGDTNLARTMATDAAREWSQNGYHSQHYWSLLALARVDLYEGDGRAAHARVERDWPRIVAAMILQVNVMAVEALHLRANAALGAATLAKGGESSRLLRLAGRVARRLAAKGDPLAAPTAAMIRAGIAGLRGDTAAASLLLYEAETGFRAISMSLHADVASFHRGRILGGDEGARIAKGATESLARQGIVSASDMAAVVAPGFPR